MEKNGFIASSLLYGMLALFLTLMISTLAIFANNKLSIDKLKEKALNDVGSTNVEIQITPCPSDYTLGTDGYCYKGTGTICSGYTYNGVCSTDDYQLQKCDIYRVEENSWEIYQIAGGKKTVEEALNSYDFKNNCSSIPHICYQNSSSNNFLCTSGDTSYCSGYTYNEQCYSNRIVAND